MQFESQVEVGHELVAVGGLHGQEQLVSPLTDKLPLRIQICLQLGLESKVDNDQVGLHI